MRHLDQIQAMGVTGHALQAYYAGWHRGECDKWMRLARSNTDPVLRQLYVELAKSCHTAFLRARARARRTAVAA
jgi:hypothetical protein